MSTDDDIAYGILVPPSRRESKGSRDGDSSCESEGSFEDDLVNGVSFFGYEKTPAHIQGDDKDDDGEDYTSLKDQIKEKDERIRGLEKKYSEMESKYKSELQTAKNELMETQSTVHLLQNMLSENPKGVNSSTKSSSSSPPLSSPSPTELKASSSLTSHQVQAIMRQNEDLKFRIERLVEEKQVLENMLRIAEAEARDAEGKLKKYITERDDAMEGVDKERLWMSTQLSNYEQQVAQLQNENIVLLQEIREEQERREQILDEMEQLRRNKMPVATVLQEKEDDDDRRPSRFPLQEKENDRHRSRFRFGFDAKSKKEEDEQFRRAVGTAKAYFAHKQQKQKERNEVSQSLRRDSSSFSSSSTRSASSSKGQAALLARHMLEKQPKTSASIVKQFKSPNGLPLTLMDEIRLEKAEQKRQKALYAMLPAE